MPNAWVPNQVAASPGTAIGASVTNQAISNEFRITAGGARTLVVALKASGVTAGAGITAKLQTAVADYAWMDSKTVAVTAAGEFYIKLMAETAADQTHLPLLGKGRVVITTGAGSALTIDSLYILVED